MISRVVQGLLQSKESECRTGGLNILGSLCGLSYNYDEQTDKMSRYLRFFKRYDNLIPQTIWETVYDIQSDWDVTNQAASIILIQVCASRDCVSHIFTDRREETQTDISQGQQLFWLESSSEKEIRDMICMFRGEQKPPVTLWIERDMYNADQKYLKCQAFMIKEMPLMTEQIPYTLNEEEDAGVIGYFDELVQDKDTPSIDSEDSIKFSSLPKQINQAISQEEEESLSEEISQTISLSNIVNQKDWEEQLKENKILSINQICKSKEENSIAKATEKRGRNNLLEQKDDLVNPVQNVGSTKACQLPNQDKLMKLSFTPTSQNPPKNNLRYGQNILPRASSYEKKGDNILKRITELQIVDGLQYSKDMSWDSLEQQIDGDEVYSEQSEGFGQSQSFLNKRLFFQEQMQFNENYGYLDEKQIYKKEDSSEITFSFSDCSSFSKERIQTNQTLNGEELLKNSLSGSGVLIEERKEMTEPGLGEDKSKTKESVQEEEIIKPGVNETGEISKKNMIVDQSGRQNKKFIQLQSPIYQKVSKTPKIILKQNGDSQQPPNRMTPSPMIYGVNSVPCRTTPQTLNRVTPQSLARVSPSPAQNQRSPNSKTSSLDGFLQSSIHYLQELRINQISQPVSCPRRNDKRKVEQPLYPLPKSSIETSSTSPIDLRLFKSQSISPQGERKKKQRQNDHATSNEKEQIPEQITPNDSHITQLDEQKQHQQQVISAIQSHCAENLRKSPQEHNELLRHLLKAPQCFTRFKEDLPSFQTQNNSNSSNSRVQSNMQYDSKSPILRGSNMSTISNPSHQQSKQRSGSQSKSGDKRKKSTVISPATNYRKSSPPSKQISQGAKEFSDTKSRSYERNLTNNVMNWTQGSIASNGISGLNNSQPINSKNNTYGNTHKIMRDMLNGTSPKKNSNNFNLQTSDRAYKTDFLSKLFDSTKSTLSSQRFSNMVPQQFISKLCSNSQSPRENYKKGIHLSPHLLSCISPRQEGNVNVQHNSSFDSSQIGVPSFSVVPSFSFVPSHNNFMAQPKKNKKKKRALPGQGSSVTSNRRCSEGNNYSNPMELRSDDQEDRFKSQEDRFRSQEDRFRSQEDQFRSQEDQFRSQEDQFRSQEDRFRSQENVFSEYPNQYDFFSKPSDDLIETLIQNKYPYTQKPKKIRSSSIGKNSNSSFTGKPKEILKVSFKQTSKNTSKNQKFEPYKQTLLKKKLSPQARSSLRNSPPSHIPNNLLKSHKMSNQHNLSLNYTPQNTSFQQYNKPPLFKKASLNSREKENEFSFHPSLTDKLKKKISFEHHSSFDEKFACSTL